MKRATYDASPKKCLKCRKPIPFEQRRNRFCGHSCAAATVNTKRAPRSAASRRKTSERMLGRQNKSREVRRCRLCWKEFEATHLARQWFCSPRCGKQAIAISLRRMQAEQSLHLKYLKSEVAPLAALNILFDTSFKKERVGGRYFDFADANYLIEHTRDYGKGITQATQRFSAAKADARTKILYANTRMLGRTRKARLTALGVLVRDYRELE